MSFHKTPPHGNISGMNKVLKKMLIEFVYGLGRALVMSRDRPYVLPAEKSFPIDAANLRRDANKIARGLSSQFKK